MNPLSPFLMGLSGLCRVCPVYGNLDPMAYMSDKCPVCIEG